MDNSLFAPVPFTFAKATYQVRLGLKEVEEIERRCAASIFSVVHQMEAGFLSTVIHVAAIAIYRESEVGFVPIDFAQIGPIVNDPDKGYTKAFSAAFDQLGNGLGLAEPSKKPLKRGSK